MNALQHIYRWISGVCLSMMMVQTIHAAPAKDNSAGRTAQRKQAETQRPARTKPATTAKPAANTKPASNKSAATAKPTTNKSAANAKPSATAKPAATTKPTANKSAANAKPATTAKPAVTTKPATNTKPVTSNTPATDDDDEIGRIARQHNQNNQNAANQSRAASNHATKPVTTSSVAKPATTDNATKPAASTHKNEPESNTSTVVQNNRGDVDDLISSAMGFLGVAYRFGGTTPSGFDCSGFMQYIFRKAFAVNLPRTSAAQAGVGVAVSRSQLQAGDMVFFRTMGNRISHVGMYIGNDRFIHAPRTGKTIEITSLSSKYWSSRFATARRVKRNNAQNFIRN